MLGAAYVRGLQSAGVIATLKHFAGYSASRAARNHGPVSMGRRELLDVILPPFETAVALGRRGLGDELLLRRRRRARRRRPLAAHRRCCATSGASPAPSSPTTGRCRSSPPCTASPPTPTRPGALALAAGIDVELPGHHRLRPRASSSGCAAASCPRTSSTGPRGGCSPRRSSSACSTRTGRRRARWPARPTVDLDSPANRALAREMAERSVVLLDAGTALPLLGDGRPPLRRVAVVGPVRRRPAHVHGLLRLPQPRAAPPPRARARHRGADRGRRAARRAARTSRSSTSRAARCRARTGPASPPRVAAARDADLCVAVVGDLAGLFGHGTSGEGCDAEDLRLPGRAGRPARRAPGHRHAGGRGGRLRPAVRAGRRARPGRRPGAGVHARRGGRRGDRRRAVRPGPARAASCRCRSRGGRAGSRAPTCSRRSAVRERRHQQPRPDAAVPVRLRHAPTPPSRSTTCGSATPRCPPTASSPCPCGSATPAPRAGEEVVQLYLHDVGRPGGPAGEAAGGFARVRLEPGEGVGRALPRARRPDRLHRPGPAADRRARRHRGAGRHVGGRPALPRHGPADRPAAVVGARPPARHPGGRAARPPARRARRRRTTCRVQARGAPRWPPSPPRPACRSRPSPRCSTAAATSPRRPARWSRTCCSEHDYVGRRARAGAGPAPTVELVFARRAQRLLHRDHPGRRSTAAAEVGVAVVVSIARAAAQRPARPSGRAGPASWSPPAARR